MDGLPMLPGSQNATLAQLMAEMRRAQEDAYAAGDMAQAGYIPNSGIGGALLMGAQGWLGNKRRTEAEKRLSDRAREYFDAQNRMQEEELRRAAAQEEARIEALTGAGLSPAQARAAVVGGIAPDKLLPKEEKKRPLQFSNGVIFDPNTGETKRTEFYQAPQAGGTEAPASIRELQAYLALPPEQQKAFDRLQGREVGPAQLSAKDQQANEMRGVSAENALNLLGQLETMTKEGVGGPVASLVPFKGLTNPQYEQYEAVRNQLVDEITRLRRVPGIGSQSDRELASLLAAIPGADTNEATRNAALANIRRVLVDIQGKIGGGASGGISGRADASGWSIEAAP